MERRDTDRLDAAGLEAVILGNQHEIRDLGADSAFIVGTWLTCKLGWPVFFWIKLRDTEDARVVLARGKVVRMEPDGAAVEFEAGDFAWPLRFSLAAEMGDTDIIFN